MQCAHYAHHLHCDTVHTAHIAPWRPVLHHRNQAEFFGFLKGTLFSIHARFGSSNLFTRKEEENRSDWEDPQPLSAGVHGVHTVRIVGTLCVQCAVCTERLSQIASFNLIFASYPTENLPHPSFHCCTRVLICFLLRYLLPKLEIHTRVI